MARVRLDRFIDIFPSVMAPSVLEMGGYTFMTGAFFE